MTRNEMPEGRTKNVKMMRSQKSMQMTVRNGRDMRHCMMTHLIRSVTKSDCMRKSWKLSGKREDLESFGTQMLSSGISKMEVIIQDHFCHFFLWRHKL